MVSWIRPYGWVVFYDSEKYVRTGNDFDRLFGNAPFVIMHDGVVHTLGTSRAAEAELAAFEHAHGLSCLWPVVTAGHARACCANLTLSEPSGSLAICPVCRWQDDGLQLREPTSDA